MRIFWKVLFKIEYRFWRIVHTTNYYRQCGVIKYYQWDLNRIEKKLSK